MCSSQLRTQLAVPTGAPVRAIMQHQCGRRNYFFWGGTAERRNYSALAWRNTKTIDIFNFEDGEMRALQRRIF